MSDPTQAPPPPPPPPPAAPPAYGPPGAPPPPGGGFPTWGIIAIILAIVLVGGGVTAVVLLTGDDEPAPLVPTSESTGTTALTSPSPAAASPSPAVANSACIAAPPHPLISCVPDKVGAFTLIEWDNAPQFAQTFNANSAIEVTFRRSDGTTLQHYIFDYPTHTEATVEKDNYVRGFEATGYTVVGETREKGINITRLQAGQEVLVWSNGLLMGVVLGPFDVTTGFFLELPY